MQLFTVHGYIIGQYVPLCFCILKDKHVSSHIECFNVINEICSSYGFICYSKQIVIDFLKINTQRVQFNLPEFKIVAL